MSTYFLNWGLFRLFPKFFHYGQALLCVPVHKLLYELWANFVGLFSRSRMNGGKELYGSQFICQNVFQKCCTKRHACQRCSSHPVCRPLNLSAFHLPLFWAFILKGIWSCLVRSVREGRGGQAWGVSSPYATFHSPFLCSDFAQIEFHSTLPRFWCMK